MSKSLIQAALVIMIMNVFSRLLGFVRETVIANQYGATSFTDAYLVAYTLPYFLQAVLGMALVSAIVPVITKYLVQEKKEEAWRIASITLNWTVLFMSVFTLVGILSARYLVLLTAPGFESNTTNLATVLTMIMFASIIFMGAGMLITGILNAQKSFATAAFAPGFSSLIIILSVIFLGRYGIHYLAWGTLLGMVGFFLIQIPVLKKVRFQYYWDWNILHPEVKGIFINLLPIFLGTAVNQLYLAINRYFASGLAEGSISALNYAGKLMNLPMGIFALAISSAIFPTLSEQAVQQNKTALAHTLARGIKLVLLITLPAAAGLMALKTPIVKLLFERGAFDALATAMTADALFYFSIGMFAMGANMVITRAYYALQDVKTPLYLGLLSILVNVAASVILIRYLGHSGLALANTLAAIFVTITMYALLRRHLPRLYFPTIFKSMVKSLIASFLTALAALFVFTTLSQSVFIFSVKKMLFLNVFLGIGIGVVVYGVSLILLKEEETINLLNQVNRKFRAVIKW